MLVQQNMMIIIYTQPQKMLEYQFCLKPMENIENNMINSMTKK